MNDYCIKLVFIRFSTLQWDPDSTRKLGILIAAHSLRDEGNSGKLEHETLQKTLAWFNEHLQIPKILKDDEHRRALSWFKPEAKEPIKRMWELTEILRHHDIEIDILKTKDPGVVIYEDGWQIVAKPHKNIKVDW